MYSKYDFVVGGFKYNIVSVFILLMFVTRFLKKIWADRGKNGQAFSHSNSVNAVYFLL